MTKLIKTFVILIFSLVGLCIYVFAVGQETSLSLDESLYNQSVSTYRTIVGNLTESFMDDYYSLQKWEKIPSKIGSQGIDGLYVKRDSMGRIRQVLVGESKYGSSALSMTKHGKQMSPEWVVQKVRELISKNEKELIQCERTLCADLEKLKKLQKDLKTINKLVSQESAYRRELFRTSFENGYLKFQFINLNTGKQEVRVVSLQNPTTRSDIKVVDAFFGEIKKCLAEQGLSEIEADNCVKTIRDKVKVGKIQNRAALQKEIISKVYDYKIKNSKTIVSRQLYKCAQKYALLQLKLPERLRAPVNAAVFVSAISSVTHGYKVLAGDESILEASKYIAKDTSLAGISMYISEGIIQIIEDRIIITTISRGIGRALGAGAGVGLGVFIFDLTNNTYAFANGDMSENEFIKETSKSLIEGVASATAVYCTMLLVSSPGGPLLMAVSIGSYIIVNNTVNHLERIRKRNFVTIEDIIWQLPVAIKVKKTAMDYELFVDSKSVLESNKIKDESVNDLSNVSDTSIINIGDRAGKTRSSESILDY